MSLTSLKTVIRRGLVRLCTFFPRSLWRRLFLIGLDSVACREPKMAMRELLEIDDDLTGLINLVATRYDGGLHVKHRLTDYHDFFVERLRPGERVLDIGCGNGAVANSMATQAQALVVGIDLDEESVAAARRLFRHPNLTFIHGDVWQELPPGPFETVVLSGVLEHFEQRVEFLRMIQERFNPRRWLIRVPLLDRHWRVPMRRELGMFYFSDRTHFTEYTPQSLAEELRAAGLTITHMQVKWGEIWVDAEL
jgi:SAM-dependent methyltransferase